MSLKARGFGGKKFWQAKNGNVELKLRYVTLWNESSYIKYRNV